MNNLYKTMNEKIIPSEELISRTISSAKPKNKFYAVIRPIAAIFIFGFIFTITAPVMASNIPGVYEIIYSISPAFGQHFMPINESSVDNNIRMEVESAYIHGNTAEIYVTMQDLTGELLDSSTDLFDSYSINRPFNSSATCKLVEYDENTHTSRFLIQISEYGKHDISGEKITFSVSQLISKKESLEDIELPINLSKINAATDIVKRKLVGLSGRGDISFDETDSLFLVPGEDIYKITDNMSISGIGYINKMLHIQLKMIDKLKLDPHGYVYLMSENGQIIDCMYAQNFAENHNSDDRIDYQEFIFDIPIEDIEKYKLYGSFYTAGVNIDGSWRVTFELEHTENASA